MELVEALLKVEAAVAVDEEPVAVLELEVVPETAVLRLLNALVADWVDVTLAMRAPVPGELVLEAVSVEVAVDRKVVEAATGPYDGELGAFRPPDAPTIARATRRPAARPTPKRLPSMVIQPVPEHR